MKAELRDRVLAHTRKQPSPSRSTRTRGDALMVGAGVLVALGVFVFWGGVGAGGRTPAELVVPAAGWALLALVATFQGVSRAGSMLGRPTRALVVVAMLTAPVIFAWATGDAQRTVRDPIFPLNESSDHRRLAGGHSHEMVVQHHRGQTIQ